MLFRGNLIAVVERARRRLELGLVCASCAVFFFAFCRVFNPAQLDTIHSTFSLSLARCVLTDNSTFFLQLLLSLFSYMLYFVAKHASKYSAQSRREAAFVCLELTRTRHQAANYTVQVAWWWKLSENLLRSVRSVARWNFFFWVEFKNFIFFEGENILKYQVFVMPSQHATA